MPWQVRDDPVAKGRTMHHDLVIFGHLVLALVLGYAIGCKGTGIVQKD
jgi:hypothetical protein